MKNTKYILAGVGIAIPLCLLVMIPLLNADSIFSNLFSGVFQNISFSGNTIKIILMIAAAYIAMYTFICSSMIYKDGETIKRQTFPAMTAATFTVILTVIYLVFCAIQIIYLFAGGVPAGVNHAEYARRGFFELLFVSVINLGLVILCVELFEKSKILTILLTIISGCTYILIASSAYRMYLYIEAYGLTFLRIFVIWFLMVLTIWITGAIYYIYKRKWNYFKFSVAVITAAYLVFVYANPDRMIIQYNIDNEKIENVDDINYCLTNLSAGEVVTGLLNWEGSRSSFGGEGAVIQEIDVYLAMLVERYEQQSIRQMNLSYHKAYTAATEYYATVQTD